MQYQPFKLSQNGPSFRMVHVPGGQFMMGSPETEPGRRDNEMQHPVRVSDFLISEFAVTQDLWTALLGENRSEFKGDRLPVQRVSWFDAVVFCNALSVKLYKNPVYLNKNGVFFGWNNARNTWELPNEGVVELNKQADGFRLPTEAQWEYAARGGPFAPALQKQGARDFWYAGSDLIDQVAWYDKNSDRQAWPVGQLLPNALGLYDMSGNLWEWCYDWYDKYHPKLEIDPVGASRGVSRVLRGGGWRSDPQGCRAAFRGNVEPDGRADGFGFRLALQSVG